MFCCASWKTNFFENLLPTLLLVHVCHLLIHFFLSLKSHNKYVMRSRNGVMSDWGCLLHWISKINFNQSYSRSKKHHIFKKYQSFAKIQNYVKNYPFLHLFVAWLTMQGLSYASFCLLPSRIGMVLFARKHGSVHLQGHM